ncbi:GntR family transcriptional regulator [Streptomyces sp. NPDC088785]|uniref:GntR family transcriptional regulator n=1 Tax=Streptomyces sp. NPDC088785 TaxID=3365897 RepID=UPI0037F4EB53
MPDNLPSEGELHHEGPGGYSMTPTWVVKRAFKDVWLYDWLRGRYGGFDKTFPAIGTIAADFGVSRSTVERTLRRLIAAKCIEVTPRKGADKRQLTNLYVTKWDEPRD